MQDLRRIAAAIALSAATLFAGPAASYDDNGPREVRHAEPGDFDYYALVLGWSPTYCLREGDDRDDPQCDTTRSHDFVLHGLWPQYGKGWPLDCYGGKRPWVPSQVIGEMRDIMPNKALIIHEYTTHGTCSGLSPEKYYDEARALYERVSIPAGFEDTEARRFLSPETIEAEFVAANDWLKPDMIAVTCRRGNLFDVRICFSRDLRPQACGANEEQKRLCRLARVTVPVPQK
jgi:ribonuclease T2